MEELNEVASGMLDHLHLDVLDKTIKSLLMKDGAKGDGGVVF